MTMLSDSSQVVTDTRQYDAFGMVVNTSGSTPTPFAFQGVFGAQSDGDSGLVLLGHRYYDSSSGRFLTRDPIKEDRNWYVFVGNNPLVNADPDGLAKVKIYARWYKLAPGRCHGFIVITDGKESVIFRGGPERTPVQAMTTIFDDKKPSPYGNIRVFVGPLEKHEDFAKWKKGGSHSTLLTTDSHPLAWWKKTLRRIRRDLDDRVEYKLLGPNSNSVFNKFVEWLPMPNWKPTLPADCKFPGLGDSDQLPPIKGKGPKR